jgi:ABC-2 type transport system ATP-binding protein
MIEINELTKYYGDFCAVDKISFNIDKGEVLGLLGPNGAGKSTTLRILTCYLEPTAGDIKVNGKSVKDNKVEIKNLIGYLPESAPIYPDMLVFEYLSFVYNIRHSEQSYKLKKIKELSDLCGLNSVMHKPISELSKGYKQRVGLAHE